MSAPRARYRVGELRPSQLLLTFGIGSVVDLPSLSVMVMGLNDWDPAYCVEVNEPRLLAAVQKQVGTPVRRLLSPPIPPDTPFQPGPLDESVLIGVPVASFPRWVVCPTCRLLAPVGSGLFALKADPYRPDRTRYVHQNCSRSAGKPPTVNPARFLVACERGHLDDFPWLWFVHRGQSDCPGPLRFTEMGVSGEAADVQVSCDGCQKQRRLVEAFGSDGRKSLPGCRGRRPHLRDYEEACTEPMTAILLGASNSWFPLVLSALSVPTAAGKLDQLVESHWAVLEKATSKDIVGAFRQIGQLTAFAKYTDEQVWQAVEARRHGGGETEPPDDLKRPEWELLSQADPERNSTDFRVRSVAPPGRYGGQFSQVVLAERLREVRALIGFTRIESPGDFGDDDWVPPERRAPLSRTPPPWLPATEVRGEGIFLRLAEDAVQPWLEDRLRRAREIEFLEAHRQWRRVRGREPLDAGFPGLRYVLLHSLAHVLMRQALLQVVGAAKASLLIVSFVAYKVPLVREAVADAARRGVSVRLVVEDPEVSQGKVAFNALEAFGPDVAARSRVYVWPLDRRPKDPLGNHGSLHAKCAVADGQALLISSANLTEHAFRLNTELGILIHGGPLPGRVERYFGSLIDRKVLLPIAE